MVPPIYGKRLSTPITNPCRRLSNNHYPEHTSQMEQIAVSSSRRSLPLDICQLDNLPSMSLRTAIAEDSHMQTLKQTILAGWPDNRADVNPDIASYFSMRDELAVHDGLIFRGECVTKWHAQAHQETTSSISPGRRQYGATLLDIQTLMECRLGCPTKQMMEKCKRSHTEPLHGIARDTQHTDARYRKHSVIGMQNRNI